MCYLLPETLATQLNAVLPPPFSSPVVSPPLRRLATVVRSVVSPPLRRLATVVGSVVPQAATTATAGCQATATAGSRAAATRSRAAAAGSRAVTTRSPPPRRRPSLFEFLAPPPSPYYECQGDGTPYLG
jgi:hypothetical protein